MIKPFRTQRTQRTLPTLPTLPTLRALCTLLVSVGGLTSLSAAESFMIHRDGTAFEVTKNGQVVKRADASTAIQYAVDNAGSGGNVHLARAIYPLTNSVNMRSGVHVEGVRRGTELRLSAGLGIAIRLDGVVNAQVSHLAVTPGSNTSGGTQGIRLNNSSQCSIADCVILGFKDYGIHAIGGSSVTVYRNTIADNGLANIYFEHVGSGNRVESNTVFWGGTGVLAESTDATSIRGNIFHRNRNRGLDADAACSSISFQGNRVYWADVGGVRIGGNNIEVKYNIITWNRGDGIVVKGGRGGEVAGNNVTDSVEAVIGSGNDLKYGVIFDDTRNVTLRANAIWNWDDWETGKLQSGVLISSNSSSNSVRYNNIHYYQDKSVDNKGSGNSIQDNSSDAGYGDKKFMPDFHKYDSLVTSFINSIRSLADGTEDVAVSIESGTCVVRGSRNNAKLYQSTNARTAIQWALDSSKSSGGCVLIRNGNYALDGQLYVGSKVWLKGESSNAVLAASANFAQMIQVAANQHQAVIEGLTLRSGGKSVSYGVFVGLAGDVKIIDCTIDGFSVNGVRFSNATALSLVNGNRIQNAGGPGVMVTESGKVVGTYIANLISKNVITDCKNGISTNAICTNMVDNAILRSHGSGLVSNGNSNLVTGHYIYQSEGQGVDGYDGIGMPGPGDHNNNREMHITNNVIVYSKGDGADIGEQWGPIVDNVIRNSGVGVGNRSGILFDKAESYTCSGNTIRNDDGFHPMTNGIFESGIKNVVAQNTAYGFTGSAAKVTGTNSINVNNTGTKGNGGSSVWAWDASINPEWNFDQAKSYVKDVIAGQVQANQLPSVALTNPANGTMVQLNTSVDFVAIASDSDGSITKVEFLVNGAVIATDTLAPYGVSWVPAQTGSFAITARATDNSNGKTVSSAIVLSVQGTQTDTNWFADSFSDGDAVGWSVRSGSWGVNAGSYQQSDPAVGLAVRGNPDWTDYAVSARVRLDTGSGDAAIVGRYGNAGNFYLLQALDSGSLRLYKYVNGTYTKLAEVPNLTTTGNWITLRLEMEGNVLRGWFNEQKLIQTTDSSIAAGSAGVRAFRMQAAFDDISAAPLTAPVGIPPLATLTSPGNGSVLALGTAVQISATASDADGTVAKVVFEVNGTSIGEDSTAPFSISWTPAQAGTYQVRARAIDNAGLIGFSAITSCDVMGSNPDEVLFADNFSDGNSTGWQTVVGSWSVSGQQLQQNNGSGEAVMLTGNSTWSNYRVEADIQRTSGSAAGLVARVVDDRNYYCLELGDVHGDGVYLWRNQDGQWTLLGKQLMSLSTAASYRLALTCEGSTLTVRLNGTDLFSRTDAQHDAGKIGVRTYRATAMIDNVVVTDRTGVPVGNG